MTICYPIENKLYINLTNRCNNNCTFCIRNNGDGVNGYNLFLESEPSAADVIEDLKRFDLSQYIEIVFCGLGEPTLALDVMLPVAEYIKATTSLPIRLNTNGLANLYYGNDITPKFQGFIDTISISLNAKNAQEYNALCLPDYGEAAFEGLKDFVRKCKSNVSMVILTVVDILPKEDIDACQSIAGELGAALRIRKMIN